MKAQIELMAILGIVAVIVVIAYYALTTGTVFPSPVPQAVSQEQNMIKDAIIIEGKKGADLAIKWLEQQGGFITPNINNSVVFTKVAVPYWQKCGDSSMKPTLGQITERLEGAVRGYINYSLHDKKEYFGKNVSFDLGRLSVSANILDNKVDFAVSLPTTVQGYAVQQPLAFSIPTKLGEIYEFGKRFADENAGKRMLEHFTIATIYFSGELETQGALTRCGESIYQSGEMISRGLRNAITYTLANTLWWQPMPDESAGSKTYSIESVGGKKYPQLGVGFYLPDGFSLGPSGPLSISNNMHVARASVFDIPVCIAVYNWKYSVSYPAVVRVRDDLTGNNFNFAVLVEVDEMEPGDCLGIRTGGAAAAMNCSAELKVVDSSGRPVEGASANFAGFLIGRSDSSGMIRGDVICGSHELAIQKAGYRMLKSDSITDINGTHTLFRQPLLNINFSSVDMKDANGTAHEPNGMASPLSYSKCAVSRADEPVWMNLSSARENYIISNADIDASDTADCSASENCALCRATNGADACRQCAVDCGSGVAYKPYASVDYAAEGSYSVDAGMADAARNILKGGFFTNYDVPEADTALNVYIPLGYNLSVYISGRAELADNMRSKCGIAPITTGSYGSLINMAGCSCTQLKGMMERELGSCIEAGSITSMFQNLSSTWGCTRPDVIAAINSCGFRVTGC